MQSITPFLMYNGRLGQALKFYKGIFKECRITSVSKGEKGRVQSASFRLNGQRFHAFDGGPHFKFSQGVSLYISCKTQKEVDYYWDKLSKGGKKLQCGWLEDPFGLCWQVIPEILHKVLGGKNEAGADRAFDAMMKMKKLDIEALKKAYDGQ